MVESPRQEATVGSEPSDKSVSFECSDCGRSYTQRSSLRRHWKRSDTCSGGAVCPTCGADHFSSEHYMKAHHKMVHGESIEGIEFECDWCGTTSRKRKYEYEKYEHSFCGEECKNAHHAKTRLGSGEGRKEHSCANCGSPVYRYGSELKGENVFCGRGCLGEWLSEAMSGENSPLWNGGYGDYRGSEWDKQRQKALERDNYTCQYCQSHQNELDQSLHVHHITPILDFEDAKRADRLENLVTLCGPCHNKWEGLYLRPDTM